MNTVRLHRSCYPTDVSDEDPTYVGAFSGPLPDPRRFGREIVNVDWSERGVVWVTYLLRGE